ncbi:MAG: hypothetical protein J6V50_05305 [Clostridia bacterium]|nr:hypothetical protein [Clostridia bacterium]
MEIGSFIDLELPKGFEYYRGNKNIARLNTGRAAIYHAVKAFGVNTVWVPFYQCETVRDFLLKKGIEVKYYRIDKEFNPVDIEQKDNEAVVIVNYFGIMSKKRLLGLAKRYKNVIIDNSQSFFSEPLKNAMNVYSARKFVGVPDGAYVIGEGVEKGVEEYPLCHSSDTAAFLFMRCEYGCEGKGYEARSLNEERIDKEDIMQMSALTRKLLDGADYKKNIAKRKENFKIADKLFKDINKIDAKMYYDKCCVPMVYPLVVEDDALLGKMLQNKHFQGHWWGYVLKEVPEDSFEYWLSRYVIPITIDQRYGREELEFLRSLV